MKASRNEAERWLRQAESDLAFAELGVREGFPAQACFTSQQAAEKALKAVLYLRGERFVPGHSLVDLLERAATSPEALLHLRDSARQLDQYYIPTRYPNGLPAEFPRRSSATPRRRTRWGGPAPSSKPPAPFCPRVEGGSRVKAAAAVR